MFGRIGNLIRGFFNLFLSNVENSNPKALLANIEENMRTDIGKFNVGLISQATVIEKLKSQVNRQTAEKADLRAKAAAFAKAGRMDAAKEAAFNLQKVDTDLTHNQEQLDAASKTYDGLVKMRDQTVKQARERIEKIKSSLSEADRNKALSNLTEVANSMISETNSHGEQLNRLDEIAENQRATSAARLKVAQGSMNLDKIDEMEAQDNALKDQALADFMAKEGITNPNAPTTQTAQVAVAATAGDEHSL